MADRQDIESLQQEAALAGDNEQVAICQRAVDGDTEAWAECERVIAAARFEH